LVWWAPNGGMSEAYFDLSTSFTGKLKNFIKNPLHPSLLSLRDNVDTQSILNGVDSYHVHYFHDNPKEFMVINTTTVGAKCAGKYKNSAVVSGVTHVQWVYCRHIPPLDKSGSVINNQLWPAVGTSALLWSNTSSNEKYHQASCFIALPHLLLLLAIVVNKNNNLVAAFHAFSPGFRTPAHTKAPQCDTTTTTWQHHAVAGTVSSSGIATPWQYEDEPTAKSSLSFENLDFLTHWYPAIWACDLLRNQPTMITLLDTWYWICCCSHYQRWQRNKVSIRQWWCCHCHVGSISSQAGGGQRRSRHQWIYVLPSIPSLVVTESTTTTIKTIVFTANYFCIIHQRSDICCGCGSSFWDTASSCIMERIPYWMHQ